MKLFKKFLFLNLSFLLALPIHLTPLKAHAVDVGGLSVGIGFCSQISKLAAIVNSYTIVQWPTGGVGLTVGMLSNTSVVMTFCDYITQLEQLDTQGAIFHTAGVLNTMTNNKWNEQLSFGRDTWDLAQQVYDMDDGTFRKGSLESETTHRMINNYIKDYKKMFNAKDTDFQTREQQDADASRMANLAKQKAILSDATTCPTPNTNDTNYSTLYKKTIQPIERLKDNAEEDWLFYRDKLYEMGPLFAVSYGDNEQYQKDINNVISSTYTFKSTDYKTSLKTKKKEVKKVNGANQVIVKDVDLPVTRQNFSVESNTTLSTEFKSKYGPKWKEYVKHRMVSSDGLRGILDDPQKRIQDEYMELNFECRERKLMLGYNTEENDADKYDAEYQKRKQECLNGIKANEKTYENLFTKYVDEMNFNIKVYKEQTAKLWTLESQHLGTYRRISRDVVGTAPATEKVDCGDNPSIAVMQQLGLRQADVNLAYNQMIAQELNKQNQMEDSRLKAEKKELEEYQKRYAFRESTNKFQEDAASQPMPLHQIRSKFDPKKKQ